MSAETKKRTSRKWRGALVYLTFLGIAPLVCGNSQADDATTNPVVGSNSVGTYEILEDAEIDVEAIETEGVWQWFSVLNGKKIVNKGNNSLTFTLTTEEPDKGLFVVSDIVLKSDQLTLKPVALADGSGQASEIFYSGTTSGNGGLRIDVGSGATFLVNGEFGHAYTDVKSGTLDVSRSIASQVKLGGLTSDGAGVVYAGTKDLIVDFDDDSLTFDGTLKGSGSGAVVYKSGSGSWTLNLAEGSKVGSINVQEGVFSLGQNHYDSRSIVNDFEIVLEKDGVFKLDTEDGATATLDALNASKGGTIQIGSEDALVLSSANKSTDLAANLYGAGCLSLKNVVDDESGEIKPWVLKGDDSNWKGTIAAYDADAEITLATAKSGSSSMTIVYGSQGRLNVETSTTVGTLKFGDNGTINITSGKTLTLGALALNDDASQDVSVTTLEGGGVLSLNATAAEGYYGATLVKGGTTLAIQSEGGDGTNETTRGTTTLTGGGLLALNYSNVVFEDETDSIWGSDVAINGEGGIVVKSKSTNGAVKMNEKIAFVGEELNNLTFTTENATVLLQSALEGTGVLTKGGAGTLVLDGSGALDKTIVSKGVLQIGTNEKVNSQLTNANVVVNGGALTGWSEKLKSINLSSGALMLTGPSGVDLTGSDTVFSMTGGAVYVGVVDEENYTNFKTTDSSATIEIKGGAFYVDTTTNNVELEEGATLTVIESSVGNISADVAKIAIYDDLARKRFVVDLDALNEGAFSLVLKDSKFSDYARTANQKNAAKYIDNFLDVCYDQNASNFFSALENSASNDASAIDQTTGEMRFSAMSAQLQTRNLIRQTLTRAVLPSATVSGIDASALRGQTNDEIGFSGWMNVVGAFGDVRRRASASGYDYAMLGGIWGVELGSATANQFGLYYSYNNTQANTKSALGKTTIGDNIFGLYLRVNDPWGYTLGTGSLGSASYKHNRYTSLQNYERQYFNGKTNGWSGDFCLERGFTFDISSVQLQPFTGFQFTHLQSDAFTESGTLRAVALQTDKTSYDSLQGTLGIRLLQSVQIAANDLEWNAYVNWTHEYLDANPEGSVAMIGASSGKIRVVGNGAGRDWVYIGAGGTYELNDAFDIFTGCDVQLNKYVALVNGDVGVRYRW